MILSLRYATVTVRMGILGSIYSSADQVYLLQHGECAALPQHPVRATRLCSVARRVLEPYCCGEVVSGPRQTRRGEARSLQPPSRVAVPPTLSIVQS